jgi:hypothetical protein
VDHRDAPVSRSLGRMHWTCAPRSPPKRVSILWDRSPQEVARGKTSAGHPWVELGYDFQGTPWRQRHYTRELSPQSCFVVTAQCPQSAADELANSLSAPPFLANPDAAM